MLERIRRDGGVSIAELADSHDVSTITVHRDLAELSAEGLIERVDSTARLQSVPAAASRLATTGQRLQRGPLLQQRFLALTVAGTNARP